MLTAYDISDHMLHVSYHKSAEIVSYMDMSTHHLCSSQNTFTQQRIDPFHATSIFLYPLQT